MKTTNAFIVSSILFLTLACSKKTDPTPAAASTTPTLVKGQAVANSYSLGGATYYASYGAEETATLGNNNDYVLVVVDGSGNSLQFWFPQKPSSGVYSASSDQTTAISSNGTLVGVTSNGVNYASMGIGTVSVSNSNGNYYVTASNIPLQNLANTSQTTSVSASLIIP